MENLIEYLDILKIFHDKITSYFALLTGFDSFSPFLVKFYQINP